MTASPQFGFCVPIFANPGMTFFRTPCYERLDWPTTRAAVLECEALGYDSVFVADHVFLGRDGAIFEGWTLLSALAEATQRVRLAPIHLCDSFRHPALAAKMIATLDVVSGRFAVVAFSTAQIDRLGHGQVPHDPAGIDHQRRDLAQVDAPAILAEMQEGVAQVDQVVERLGDRVIERKLIGRPQEHRIAAAPQQLQRRDDARLAQGQRLRPRAGPSLVHRFTARASVRVIPLVPNSSPVSSAHRHAFCTASTIEIESHRHAPWSSAASPGAFSRELDTRQQLARLAGLEIVRGRRLRRLGHRQRNSARPPACEEFLSVSPAPPRPGR